MDNSAFGLVIDSVTVFTNAEAVVRIFIKCGPVAIIEATYLAKERAPCGEQST
jgi:hypothetical protein